MFIYDLLTQTHFEHFKQDNKSFITIQERSKREQRSQTIFINIL
jgi:hypothetical protein